MQTPITFSMNIKVQPDDIDNLGHVNNVVYVRWAQDVAYQHWVRKAPKEILNKYSWVVLRHEIDYKSPAFREELIEGETWVAEFNGPRSIRHVKFTRSNKTLCEVKTTWCVLDTATMWPARVPDDLTSIFTPTLSPE